MIERAMLAAACLAGVAAIAGCSPGSSATSGFWTHQRMAGAQDFGPHYVELPAPGSTPEAKQHARTFRVGVLFETGSSGNHFCTASAVDSPGRNVIVTAAHCVNGGSGGPDKQDIVFAPGYADGNTPFGLWTPVRYFMDSRWRHGHDDRLDVAFLVLAPRDGKNIQDVIGANKIAFNAGYRHYDRVAGYPSSADAPVRCWNWTSRYQRDYLKFACSGFYSGTSGSPLITGFDRHMHSGTVVGLIGGYQQGGTTPDVSYSDYFGDDIEKLYKQATSS